MIKKIVIKGDGNSGMTLFSGMTFGEPDSIMVENVSDKPVKIINLSIEYEIQ